MIVLVPLPITEAMLTACNAPEPGVSEQAYAAGTTYGVGERVIIGSPTATVTISIASPGVITWANHGQPEGTPLVLTTTGALPTGLQAGRIYYVRNPGDNTLQLALTRRGVPIVTTGTQSGTHTATTQVHRVFESLQAGNVGKYPLLPASASWWKDVGPTNRWAAFDLRRNSATELAGGTLTFTVTPGQRVDGVALLGLDATSARVQVSSGGSPVYDTGVIDLNTRNVTDWYGYFFAAFATAPSLLRLNVPPYTDAVITVTLTNSTGPVACGAFVVGMQVYLGEAQLGAVSDATNFSAVERDEDGNATLIERRTIPRPAVRVLVEKPEVPIVRELRQQLNGVPAVWSALDDLDTDGYFEALLALGVFRRFGINLDHPTHAVLDLEIEEI